MKVSILGEMYSFHHIAALQYWDNDIECLFHQDFDRLIDSVVTGEADHGVIAVENSIAGDVPGNYNRVARSGLHICGEIDIHLDMHLAAKQDVPPGNLHTVISHPMALKETAGFFKPYPQIRLVPATSTSTAARTVAEQQDPGIGAIANLAAIRFYNLQIIAKNIDNLPNNVTHFLILSKDKRIADATSLRVKASLLLPGHEPFPEGDIGLTKVIDNGLVYIELPEADRDLQESRIAKILSNSAGARVLGLYPGGVTVSGS